MDARDFWTTKSPLPEYHTVRFSHPEFVEPFRLVANKFAPVTLGGESYRPVSMTVKPPDQSGDGQAKLSLAFQRAVVGREFKQALKLVTASGSREPIEVRYAVFLDNLTTPAMTWELFVSEAGGVTFTTDSVQVVASDDNPLRRAVAPVYDPAIFTGLALL